MSYNHEKQTDVNNFACKNVGNLSVLEKLTLFLSVPRFMLPMLAVNTFKRNDQHYVNRHLHSP